MTHGPRTFWGDFKVFFLRGLGILLPSILTLWLVVQAGLFLLDNVAEPINAGVRTAIIRGVPSVVPEDRLPAWFRVDDDEVAGYAASPRFDALEEELSAEPDAADIRFSIRRDRLDTFWNRYDLLGFKLLDTGGLLIAIMLLYLAGALLGGFIGRSIYERVEALLARIPIFKQIYPHIKQLVDLIIGERKMAFRRSVLVEYPGKDVWTIGLVTGQSMAPVSNHLGEPAIAVFIPTSPTPMTGFTINVRESAVIDLDISVDEALRYVISAGVLIPDRHAPPEEAPAGSPTPAIGAADPTDGAPTDPAQDPGSGGSKPESDGRAGSAA
ncbi:MAG: DUF502 domain-containing protein [Myxococcota bacterium]